jgi:hypothetical protein
VKPEVNSVCTIMIAVVALVVVAASLTGKLAAAHERATPLAARV